MDGCADGAGVADIVGGQVPLGPPHLSFGGCNNLRVM